ncbi:MAG: DUF1566 domain-containing protein [Bacteroidota bacterium]
MKIRLLLIITLGVFNNCLSQYVEIEGKMKVDTVLQSTDSDKVLMHENDNSITHVPISKFDTSQVNELQLLSFSGDTIFISDGNFIILPGLSYLSTLLPPVQSRLDNGETPCEIINSGVSIDSLYGKFYEGGLIFYVDLISCETLIALSISLNQEQWGCQGQNITGANSQNVGDGENNTISIVSNCNEANFAAKTAWILNNGYTDWYLPSLNELLEIYNKLYAMNYGSYENAAHWSSTQSSFDSNKAWTVFFENGNWNSAVTKSTPSYLIPVRTQQ